MPKIRKGIKSIWWKPYFVKGAAFSEYDVPFCPTTTAEIPKSVITYSEAKTIYKKELRKGNRSFHSDSFVCFYEDDVKFDGIFGIWFRSSQAYKVLSHFQGIFTPDFSTYADFPLPLKLWNTYRMRAFGYWYGVICGGQVINNVRWGTAETYWYCFDGIPKNSIIAVGTVGGNPRKLTDRERFEDGLKELVKVLSPRVIIVYGSADYPCFDELRAQGIEIIAFPSKTSKVFAGRAK